MHGVNCRRLIVFVVIIIGFSAGACSSALGLTFVTMADTHIRTQENIDSFRCAIQDVNSLKPAPKFVVVAGDLTDLGSYPELEQYVTIIERIFWPVYHVMGNHDSRWTALGKTHFTQFLGPLYQSLDFDDVHIALLDSSVELEQYGHIPVDQLAWLEKDLSATLDSKLKIVVSHHPPFEHTGRQFIDNEDALMEILTRHKVRLYFAGHLHQNTHTSVNGTEVVTCAAVMGREKYRIIDVRPDEIEVRTRDFRNKEETVDLTFDRQFPALPEWQILSPQPGAQVRYSLGIQVLAPGFTEIAYQVDSERGDKLKKTGDAFTGRIPTAVLCEGRHLLRITAKQSDGRMLTRSVPFKKARRRDRIVLDFQASSGIQSSPLVVTEKRWLGFGSRERVFFGSNDGYVYALDPGNGECVWKTPTGAPVLSSPAYWKGRVFIGSDDGNLYCLRSSDGKVLWRHFTDGAVYSAPRVENGIVYFGSGDNFVYALDGKNGEELWRFETGKLVKCRPEVAAGKTFFGSWDMFFYAVDSMTGDLQWKFTITEDPFYPAATSNPIYADGLVVVASHDYRTHAFDASSGKEVWVIESTDTRKPSYSTAAIEDGRAYYGSITGHVLCLDVKSGNEIWNTAVNDPIFDSSPLICGDRVYVGSIGGDLYGLNKETGELTDRVSLGPGNIFSSPCFQNGILYIGSLNGHLFGVSLPGQ